MDSNASVLPYDLSILQCNNCTLAAAWFVTQFTSVTGDIGIFTTAEYIRDCISSYLNESNTPTPSDSQIVWWFLHSDDNILYTLGDFARYQCRPDLCTTLGWRGDSDIAGSGMLVTYYLQAVLALLYAISNIKALTTPKPLSRLRLSFQHSSRTFLESSIIYSAAMLIAALVSLHRGLVDPTMTRSTFSLYATTLASLVCLLSTVLAHVCIQGNLHRTNWVFWRTVVLTLLATVVSIISLFMFAGPGYDRYTEKEKDDNAESRKNILWEAYCEGESWVVLQYGALVQIAILGLVAILCVSHFAARFLTAHRRRRNTTSGRQHSRASTRIIDGTWFMYTVACLSILGSWGPLLLFTYVVYQFNTASGPSPDQNEWTFGQVLALATWVPVLVDFAYVYIEGPQEAYTGQMAEPFIAATNPETPEPGASSGETHAFLGTQTEENGVKGTVTGRQENIEQGLRMSTV